LVFQENKPLEKVTVIVPFYNVEDYIEECLESLVNQTHHNLEILCVDDCSPDGTLNIVNSYAARDSRIKVIGHEQNKGLGGARNTGISCASADYICFVDSDDYVSDNFVERLHQSMINEGTDIAVCGFQGFNDDKEQVLLAKYDDDIIVVGESKDNVFDCARQIRGASWLKMYRRALLCQNNIWQPEHRYYEGVVFWLRSIYYSSKISTTSDVLYNYRLREGSIMRSFSHKHIEDRFDYIRHIDDFFRSELLSTSGINIYKATQDALTCLMEHMYYGETLIKDFGGESSQDYLTHFQRELLRFSIEHKWPDLPTKYEAYAKKRSLKPGDHKTKEQVNIDRLRSKLNATQQQLAKVQRELDSVYVSRSWRLTSPVRRLAGIFKK
jgi:glycosyltransferase involved in cell wall biosynthesis